MYTSQIHTWAYLQVHLDRSRSHSLRETSHDGKYADRGTPGGMHFEAHCLESEDEPEGIEAMEATPCTASSPSRWKHCSPVLQSLSESQSPPPAAHGEDVVQPEPPLFTATAGSTKHRECKDSVVTATMQGVSDVAAYRGMQKDVGCRSIELGARRGCRMLHCRRACRGGRTIDQFQEVVDYTDVHITDTHMGVPAGALGS